MTEAEKIARIFSLSHLGCEDRLVETELAELESLLLGDAAAQRTYLLLAEQDMQLSWLAKHALAVASSSEVVAGAESTTSRLVVLSRLWNKHPLIWSIAGCAALFVIYFALISWGMLGNPLVGDGEVAGAASSSRTVAAITNTAGVKWSDKVDKSPRDLSSASRRDASTEVSAGEQLSITSGLVELQLKQGARLVVEGPAMWSIDGDNAATLKQGRLVAYVPRQAVGFLLDTPSSRIVDLGTEFAVEVDSLGRSETLVRRGQVEVEQVAVSRQTGGEPRRIRLSAGQAVRASANGLTATDNPNFQGFSRIIQFRGQRSSSVAAANVLFDRTLHFGANSIDPAPRQITHVENSRAGAMPLALAARSDFGVVQDWNGFVGWRRDPAKTNILAFRNSRPDVEFQFNKIGGDDVSQGNGAEGNEPRWATSGTSSSGFGFVGLQSVRATHTLTISFGTYGNDGFEYDQAVQAVGFTLNNINGGDPPTRYRAEFQNAAGDSLFRSNWVEGKTHASLPAIRPNVFFAHAVAADAPSEDWIARVVITEERRGGPGSGHQVGLDDFGFTINSTLTKAKTGR